ncbi:uncharacterized protein PHACADRAFT_106956, partial [Phanerochaete carnosa HHB-10118-sp]
CLHIIGYMRISLGIAGPLKVNGERHPVLMATAEGALAASTSHGCKALNSGEGDTTIVTYDGMIREPAIDLPNNVQAAAARVWIENSEGHAIAKEAFESTLPLRYAPERQVVKRAMAGRTLYIRFTARIDDAMGTNMVSKARSSRRSRWWTRACRILHSLTRSAD